MLELSFRSKGSLIVSTSFTLKRFRALLKRTTSSDQELIPCFSVRCHWLSR
jgi:hypothetical protein